MIFNEDILWLTKTHNNKAVTSVDVLDLLPQPKPVGEKESTINIRKKTLIANGGVAGESKKAHC